tara:strand:- start:501 stop:698 length:198 start_codon:yes stop_codon:yes gene_type:complete
MSSNVEDPLYNERIRVSNLIANTLIENTEKYINNLNKPDNEIEEYDPLIHGDLKIITVIKKNNNN